MVKSYYGNLPQLYDPVNVIFGYPRENRANSGYFYYCQLGDFYYHSLGGWVCVVSGVPPVIPIGAADHSKPGREFQHSGQYFVPAGESNYRFVGGDKSRLGDG